MSEWKPIETAPKDGTEIWVGAPGRVILGYSSFGKTWRSSWSGNPLQWEPTHWMEWYQPAPPVEAKSEVVG